MIKKILSSLLLSVLSLSVWAAETPPSTVSTDFSLHVNDVLVFCVFLLLTVILVLGYTLRSAILFYHERRKKESEGHSSSTLAKMLLLLVGIMGLSQWSIAQDAVSVASETASASLSDSEVLRWILYVVIALETVVIFVFAKWIRFFTGIEHFSVAAKKQVPYGWKRIWERMNRFKSLEEEASIDTGHSYDGIRELNNVTPPWFIAGFALSILFSITYLWRYHVAKAAPLQIEEYENSVSEAKEKIEAYLKTQANNVDENSVQLLDASGIAAGQALFASNCVACHGPEGQGAAIGPNLADNYWLHKGGIKDIFKSIKYGWPEKGMRSWKEDFSPNQIAQLASYVYALRNTHPANPKEAQGELYEEQAAAELASDTSTATK